jgi:hypothetical protein
MPYSGGFLFFRSTRESAAIESAAERRNNVSKKPSAVVKPQTKSPPPVGAVWVWDGALVEKCRLLTPSRLKAGEPMSRGEVAELLDTRAEAVRRWEVPAKERVGDAVFSSPSATQIGRLASLFNVTPAAFYSLARAVAA